MKIKYTFADGEISEVEVNEEVGEFIIESRRQEENYERILIDRGMKKKDLEEAAGIKIYQMYKLANDKDITTDVIGAICTALEVSVDDILEFVSVKEK